VRVEAITFRAPTGSFAGGATSFRKPAHRIQRQAAEYRAVATGRAALPSRPHDFAAASRCSIDATIDCRRRRKAARCREQPPVSGSMVSRPDSNKEKQDGCTKNKNALPARS
jgi:hypothetical protein